MQDLAPFDVPRDLVWSVEMLLRILWYVGLAILVGLGVIYRNVFGPALGWIGTAVFALVTIGWVRLVFQRRPVLRISTEGLEDRSYLPGAGFVPWSDITLVRLWTYEKQTFLAADVRDPDQFARQHGTRWLRGMSRRIGAPPIGIPVNMIPPSIGLPRVIQEIRRRSSVAIAPDLLAMAGLG